MALLKDGTVPSFNNARTHWLPANISFILSQTTLKLLLTGIAALTATGIQIYSATIPTAPDDLFGYSRKSSVQIGNLQSPIATFSSYYQLNLPYLFESNSTCTRFAFLSGTSGIVVYEGDLNNNFSKTAILTGDNLNDTISGLSMNSNGDLIAFGTPGASPRGKVFLYRKEGNNWVYKYKFTGDTPDDFDYFGKVVRFNASGNFLYISAPGDTNDYNPDSNFGVFAGAIYAFTGQGANWLLSNKITGNRGYNTRFGDSFIVNGSGDKILSNVGFFIGKTSQTITFPSIPDKLYLDAPFSLNATASSNLGVTYTSSNTNVATINGNTVTVVGVGSATITASQPGNSNYNSAVSVSQNLTINKKNQLIELNIPSFKSLGDLPFNLQANSNSNLPIYSC